MNSLPETSYTPTDLSDLLKDGYENDASTEFAEKNTSRKTYLRILELNNSIIQFLLTPIHKISSLLMGLSKYKGMIDFLRESNFKQRSFWFLTLVLSIISLNIVFYNEFKFSQNPISALLNPNSGGELVPLKDSKPRHEVFGFAPYWTFNKLDNVDFSTLTTFAYFGVEVDGSGNLDRTGVGYQTFRSEKATEIFKKAHSNGTRVVLTVTQMKNGPILELMDNPEAQANMINQTVAEVKNRGIDGINVDLEYTGDPGSEYRVKFSTFVKNLTDKMHQEVPNSRVTVSVYASAVKEPKIYDIGSVAAAADGIFMMAYDFAVAGSDNAIPTAPLYGHKEGKYWYDISTAVEHFVAQMPSEKLILGVPWYGYNYAVNAPQVKAARNKGYYSYYKKGRRTYSYFVPIRSHAQTYSIVQNDIEATQSGWDEYGQVGWKAYQAGGTWRMIFMDDPKSLAIKYDFAKEKNLAGIGMWALGFDEGKSDMWVLLKEKFGEKNVADSSITGREIH